MDEFKKIHFQITTPERTVYDQAVDSVSLPTTQGEITVLPGHIPLVSLLVPGEVKLRIGNQEEYLAISGGFIEVRQNKIVILADTAEMAHEINLEQIEAAKKQAEALMQEKRADSVEYAAAMAVFERELARIKVARKHRQRQGPSGMTNV